MTAPEPEQIVALTTALDSISKELSDLRGETHIENVKRDKRIRWSRWMIGAVTVLAVLALVVGYTAKATGDDIIAARKDARVQSCDQDNARNDSQRASFDDVAVAIKTGASVVNTPNPNRTAEQQAAIDGFIAKSSALYTATLVAPRDCSPAGIEAFYKTGGN